MGLVPHKEAWGSSLVAQSHCCRLVKKRVCSRKKALVKAPNTSAVSTLNFASPEQIPAMYMLCRFQYIFVVPKGSRTVVKLRFYSRKMSPKERTHWSAYLCGMSDLSADFPYSSLPQHAMFFSCLPHHRAGRPAVTQEISVSATAGMHASKQKGNWHLVNLPWTQEGANWCKRQEQRSAGRALWLSTQGDCIFKKGTVVNYQMCYKLNSGTLWEQEVPLPAESSL